MQANLLKVVHAHELALAAQREHSRLGAHRLTRVVWGREIRDQRSKIGPTLISAPEIALSFASSTSNANWL